MEIKIIYIFLAYLCGAIPFAYIFTKIFVGVDIRTVGSGNPGTTNVFRAAGKVVGILTFLADTFKGFIPVYLASKYVDDTFLYLVVVAIAALIGHMYTVFLRFKGGKGVASGLGVFLALVPQPSGIAFGIFILIFIISGYVSLASICAVLILPILSYFFGYPLETVIFVLICALAVVYKHKNNIKRLINGTENRFQVFKRR